MTPAFLLYRHRGIRINSWHDLLLYALAVGLWLGATWFYKKFFPEWDKDKCGLATALTVIVGGALLVMAVF